MHHWSHDKIVACLLFCWSGDACHLKALFAVAFSVLMRGAEFSSSRQASQTLKSLGNTQSGGHAPLLQDCWLVRVEFILSHRILSVLATALIRMYRTRPSQKARRGGVARHRGRGQGRSGRSSWGGGSREVVVASAVLRRLSTSIGADLPKDPHHHRTAPAVAIPAARGRRRQRLPLSGRAARSRRARGGGGPHSGLRRRAAVPRHCGRWRRGGRCTTPARLFTPARLSGPIAGPMPEAGPAAIVLRNG